MMRKKKWLVKLQRKLFLLLKFKIGIPESVLNKAGSLTDEEYEMIKGHVEASIDIIRHLPSLDYVIPAVIGHHERYDGKGYPDGLVGDEIPISAQLVSIADVYDALTSERVYKKAFSHEKAMQMIREGECGAFNPLLLSCLEEIADELQAEM